MWQLDNRTAFAAERGWVRDRTGAEVWLVVVKATFTVLPDGSTVTAAEQPPVLRIPEYLGAPGMSSLRYDTDMVLAKQTTDVLALGHAYAPAGKAVTELDVGLRVGPVQKILRVVGDRWWQSARLTAPQPFTRMPLIYERAYGGVDLKSPDPERDRDSRNPVGRGFACSQEHLEGVAAPNIEWRDRPPAAWDDRPPPAGFGPLCGHWQPRAALAGTYDDAWMKTRQPLLPEDFDPRFFQCAPIDQQAPRFLTGGEPVVAINMAPGGALRFSLPRLHLGFETRFYDGSREIQRSRKLHTVILEPEVARVSLVWHSALPCHFKVQKLQRTIITLKTDLRRQTGLKDRDAAGPADE